MKLVVQFELNLVSSNDKLGYKCYLLQVQVYSYTCKWILKNFISLSE